VPKVDVFCRLCSTKPAFFLNCLFIFINFKLFFIDKGEMTMERIATITGEWAATEGHHEHTDSVASKVLEEVLGIIKDTLVMSVVVMGGAALTMLLW
jgi:hypothetical protein